MRETSDHIEGAKSNKKCGTSYTAPPVAWSMTATAKPREVANFEAVLLAIAGHDLRQPLQVIQSAHELLGLGVRTSSELRCLRSGRDAIDRLSARLEQIMTALRIRECSSRLELKPLSVHQVLRQAYRENERAALS
jgi:two-component system phosphate regulon sensor histidine kinase PhoR